MELRLVADYSQSPEDEAMHAAELAWIEKVRSCPEHKWEMTLFHPEDDSYIDLVCSVCGGGLHEAKGPDLIEFAHGEFDGYVVEYGKHNLVMENEDDFPVTVPVDVDVEYIIYPATPDHGEEYDVLVNLSLRSNQ